jgi:vanillate O-demethylase monooxygenase subunit
VGYGKDMTTTLSAFAAPAGEDPSVPVERSGRMIAVAPALSYAIERVEPHDPDSARLRCVIIAHCVTPADLSTTHQFWMYWHNVPFAMEHAAWAATIEGVFNQDVEALGWIQDYVDRERRDGVVEQSVPGDVPGLRLRRLLHRLAAAEQD